MTFAIITHVPHIIEQKHYFAFSQNFIRMTFLAEKEESPIKSADAIAVLGGAI